MMLDQIRNRIYADMLMPSRLGEYQAFLELALDLGYHVLPVGTFARLQAEPPEAGKRVLVLRHDIDTDLRTAAAMWLIDRRLGIRSSYFFRLSTLDLELMSRIEEAGGEAGYHYEELASIIRKRRLHGRDDALAHLPEARALFATNLGRLRDRTGLPMRVVAAHGDFANRKVGTSNWEILADPSYRASVEVEVEAYDDALLSRLPARFTDTLHPRYWIPANPEAALRTGEPVVSVLVHPRHWQTDGWGNACDNAGRALAEIRYRLGR